MSATTKVPTLKWVRECYNKLATEPGAVDPWHIHTHHELEEFVKRNAGIMALDATILNAGSGGKKLGMEHPRHIQIDVADLTLVGAQNAAVADVQYLPFRDSSFDLELCIGCVINYCDPVIAIGELARTLKPGGRLIIDYERSRSWEYLFRKSFDKDAYPVTTFYRDTTQVLWVYSDRYIRNALSAAGLKIRSFRYFHLLSPLLLKVTGSGDEAARACFIDPIARKLPFLNQMAGHVICLCEKPAED